MIASAILNELRARGIKVEVVAGHRIKLTGDEKALTAELAERARVHKYGLLGLLIGLPQEVLNAIGRIESEAVGYGWTLARLWNPAFWPNSANEPRGLASIMTQADSIGRVSAEFILVHHADGRCSHFPRRDG